MKTRLRLQLMIGLLFLAMTISMIAVSFAWFSASPGEVKVSGSNVSITTADNNYTIDAELILIGQVDVTGKVTKKPIKPYCGEVGLDNEIYILLFKLNNPSAATGNCYVEKCITSISDEEGKYEFDAKDLFTVSYVSYNEETNQMGKYNPNESLEYVMIEFKDATLGKEFKFSDRRYMGTTFELIIAFESTEGGN